MTKGPGKVVLVLMVASLGIAGCGSDSDETTPEATSPGLAISYQATYHSDTKAFEWRATGPAVDEGLICREATMVHGGWELEDGTPLTEAELGALNDGTEPFTYVSFGTLSCVDGSGSFAMRETTVATNPAAFEFTTTWELQGGEGYEGVVGEGQLDETTFDGQPVVIVGYNSGTLHSG